VKEILLRSVFQTLERTGQEKSIQKNELGSGHYLSMAEVGAEEKMF
jgi:hypothetical protein